MTTKYSVSPSATIGAILRQLRKDQKLPLRTVAAAAEIDSTLLSKIELGQRLPTEEQLQAIASFFKTSFKELEAKRLAERFWRECGSSPAAKEAVNLIQEQAVEYTASKRGTL